MRLRKRCLILLGCGRVMTALELSQQESPPCGGLSGLYFYSSGLEEIVGQLFRELGRRGAAFFKRVFSCAPERKALYPSPSSASPLPFFLRDWRAINGMMNRIASK